MFAKLISLLAIALSTATACENTVGVDGHSISISCHHENYTQVGIVPANNCIQFTVGSGTGCSWMCNYCANQLGTFNYYFTDGVCTYQTGGCVGNPVAGKVYSCCAV